MLVDFNHLLSILTTSDINCDIRNEIPSYCICKDIVHGLTAVIGDQPSNKEDCNKIVIKESFHKLLKHIAVFNQIGNDDWKHIL